MAACKYDGGDGAYSGTATCPSSCTGYANYESPNDNYDRKIGNGVCETECNTPECNYDGGNHSLGGASNAYAQEFVSYEYYGSTYNVYGDGNCDPKFNTAACNWDGGDCAPTAGKTCPDECRYTMDSYGSM